MSPSGMLSPPPPGHESGCPQLQEGETDGEAGDSVTAICALSVPGTQQEQCPSSRKQAASQRHLGVLGARYIVGTETPSLDCRADQEKH